MHVERAVQDRLDLGWYKLAVKQEGSSGCVRVATCSSASWKCEKQTCCQVGRQNKIGYTGVLDKMAPETSSQPRSMTFGGVVTPSGTRIYTYSAHMLTHTCTYVCNTPFTGTQHESDPGKLLH